ncbi:MAG TPA: replication factor C small subunit [Candidatus Thermoplasmatota archaeon]|nr:replication factor C small subunit [Candidatus Thermoplasmatota archaeon]
MKEVWIEKYRPRKLADVVGQADITERLQAYVKQGNLPHLLFAGRAGVGKTTCAIALARELYGEKAWHMNFQEFNASDERGIDVVREKIKDFARTAPIGDAQFKIIFLDEADALTSDAQAALRRTMEKYTRTCRFVLSCNYSSKIIEPIQSRCAVFRFRPVSKEATEGCLRDIAKGEGITIKPDGLEAIIYLSQGDLRRATNALQVAAATGKAVDSEIVYQATASVHPEKTQELLKAALEGDFMGARKLLDTMLIDEGLAGEDIIRAVHKGVFDLPIPDKQKVELVDKIGEIDFRMVEGSTERIQLEALLAHFTLVGGEGKGKR